MLECDFVSQSDKLGTGSSEKKVGEYRQGVGLSPSITMVGPAQHAQFEY